MVIKKDVVERFWEKVNKDDPIMPHMDTPCWEWIGTINSTGYGFFWVSGKYVNAHRFSYELHNEVIPKGMHVLHKCDYKPCVNPEHLFLGTRLDNMKDMVSKGRQAKGEKHGSRTHPERLARGERNGNYTHPESYPKGDNHYLRIYPEKVPRGEANGNSKLVETQVVEILAIWRQAIKKHGLITKLSLKYNISEYAISCIVKRNTWKHIIG